MTDAHLQMIACRTWQEYARSAQVDNVTANATILPVLTTKTLASEARSHVDDGGDETAGDASEFSQLDLTDALGVACIGDLTDRDWRRLWLWGLARSAGLEVSINDAESALRQAALDGHRWLFVLDGLEDVFQNIVSDLAEQRAVRALTRVAPSKCALL